MAIETIAIDIKYNIVIIITVIHSNMNLYQL